MACCPTNIVAGHSLGGALAHLFFGTLLLAKQATAKQPDGSSIDSPALDFEAVYTFGEPRIGDQVWVENVEDALRAVACGGEYKAEDRWVFQVSRFGGHRLSLRWYHW